jgi:hypothetical protein
MKTKILLIISAALVTLSFTFVSVNTGRETGVQTTKTTVEEPIGGFVSEGKL